MGQETTSSDDQRASVPASAPVSASQSMRGLEYAPASEPPRPTRMRLLLVVAIVSLSIPGLSAINRMCLVASLVSGEYASPNFWTWWQRLAWGWFWPPADRVEAWASRGLLMSILMAAVLALMILAIPALRRWQGLGLAVGGVGLVQWAMEIVTQWVVVVNADGDASDGLKRLLQFLSFAGFVALVWVAMALLWPSSRLSPLNPSGSMLRAARWAMGVLAAMAAAATMAELLIYDILKNGVTGPYVLMMIGLNALAIVFICLQKWKVLAGLWVLRGLLFTAMVTSFGPDHHVMVTIHGGMSVVMLVLANGCVAVMWWMLAAATTASPETDSQSRVVA